MLQEESQRGLINSSDFNVLMSMDTALLSNNSYQQQHQQRSKNSKWNMICDYYHYRGHHEDICYKKNGYPPGYKKPDYNRNNNNNGGRYGGGSEVGGSSSARALIVGVEFNPGSFNTGPMESPVESITNSSESGSQNFTLSKEQYEELLHLLTRANTSEPSSGSVQAHMAGPLKWEGTSDW